MCAYSTGIFNILRSNLVLVIWDISKSAPINKSMEQSLQSSADSSERQGDYVIAFARVCLSFC